MTACHPDNREELLARDWAPTVECGDGFVDTRESPDGSPFEACDDGNDDDRDHCTNDCLLAACGDGFVRRDLEPTDEDYEECDDGNAVETDNCTVDCRMAACGDGYVRLIQNPDTNAAYEECDDGNGVNEDSCTAECRLAVCGDGILRSDLELGTVGFEECDDGNLVSGDGCGENCISERCGDSVTMTGEQCDDGNFSDTDACTSFCVAAVCGDGIVRTDLAADVIGHEQCDDGNENNADSCLNTCEQARCGDGIIRTFGALADLEACDDGNQAAGDGCDDDCTLSAVNRLLAVGYGYSCALSRGEDVAGVHCWGRPVDEDGAPQQARQGDVQPGEEYAIPYLVSGSESAASVHGGDSFSCYRTRDGDVACWGMNTYAQLGREGSAILPTAGAVAAERVDGLSGIRSLDLGRNHGCALTRRGTVLCWGDNQYGQVDPRDRETLWRASPVEVHFPGHPQRIALGAHHSCALSASGEVHCTGHNNSGQIGDGNARQRTGFSRPVRELGSVLGIAAGSETNCAWTASTISCWGRHSEAQIPSAFGANQEVPFSPLPQAQDEQVFANPTGWVTAGADVFCTRDDEGIIVCWGSNRHNLLTRHRVTVRTTPVTAGGYPEAASSRYFSIGRSHACAGNANEAITCWGSSLNGQVGGGSGPESIELWDPNQEL